MKITFDNVLEKVVNNRMISRKEKQNEIRRFLKEYSGKNKPSTEEELATLETLKTIKKGYSQLDNNDKIKDKQNL
jgi:ribosomal protein L13